MRVRRLFPRRWLGVVIGLEFLLVVAYPAAGAPVVEGYVSDESGNAVPGILVICDSPRSAVRTDEFGYFVFPVAVSAGERLFRAYGSHTGGKLVGVPHASDDPSGDDVHLNAPFKVRRCPSDGPCALRPADLNLAEGQIAPHEIALLITRRSLSERSSYFGSAAGSVPGAWSRTEAPVAGIVRVHYATDRQRDSSGPGFFGSARSDPATLTLGTIDVTIPRDHRLARVERPTFLTLTTTEQRAKHLTIITRTIKEPEAFYGELADRIRASQNKQAFVFIHGYNVGFDDAVYRTAQISYDLAFDGPAILYSWPSNGALLDYTRDLNNSEWGIGHLAAFLGSLTTHGQAKDIHLIAHSMGNRVLVGAIQRLLIESPSSGPRFSQVVLTAPDIDAGVFKELADAVKASASRVTLYASATDRALRASKRINGYPRAGDAGAGIVVLPGVDTIDVSSVDSDLLGHAYYGDNRSVLSDMFNLLRGQAPPRFGLGEARAGALKYWRFLP